MRRYGLRDDQWERLETLIKEIKGKEGRPSRDDRMFIEGVLYRYRSGCAWRDVPERYGDWKNLHRRFSRWAKRGVWQKIFDQLSSDADNEYAMIDSTIVRAHQHSAGAVKKKTPMKLLDVAKED